MQKPSWETTPCIKEKEESDTIYAHKIEACESKRCRISESAKHKHEEQVADRGYISMSLYTLIHLPLPIPKAIRIPEAKVAVDREWNKLKNTSVLARIRSKKQKRSDRGNTAKRQTSSFLQLSWTCAISKDPKETINSRSTKRPSCYVVMH